jgi:hypothetical protein
VNNLNEDITGKVVILKQEYFQSGLRAEDHPFQAKGGFGCLPHTNGRGVMGAFLSDGERARVEGYDIERYATDEEIERAPLAKEVLGR